jgi:hypothetical protein
MKPPYAKIAGNLQGSAGIHPEDVFIYLSENDFSDWSVGNGQMSMEIVQQRCQHEAHGGRWKYELQPGVLGHYPDA